LTEVAVREAEVLRHQKAREYEQATRAKVAAEFGRIACQKGCHNCCYYPIAVSPLEGITIYRWLHAEGHWKRAFKAKLQETHEKVWGLAASVWLLGMFPCALLKEDGTCIAYDVRPFACRTTLSVGPAEDCHPHRFGEQSGIIPRREVGEALVNEEDKLMKSAKIPAMRLPLATAILLGERLCSEDTPADDVLRQLLAQLSPR
jgi:Fe-S-cluster containining protein